MVGRDREICNYLAPTAHTNSTRYPRPSRANAYTSAKPPSSKSKKDVGLAVSSGSASIALYSLCLCVESVAFEDLFAAQCDDRFDADGTAGGQSTGQQHGGE